MSEVSNTEPATRVFRLFAENAAAITLICTAFSLTINFFRFRFWGLDYAAVVAPSDIIVGGIDTFSLFFPFFVAAILGIWAGRRTRKIFSSRRIRAITAGLTAIPIVIWIALFPWNYGIVTGNALIWYASYVLALMFWFESLAISGNTIFLKGDSQIALWGNLGLVSSTIMSMFVVFALDDIATASDISLTNSNRCDGREFVVWMGTESVVTTCEIDKIPLERAYYIVERDGLEFSVTN